MDDNRDQAGLAPWQDACVNRRQADYRVIGVDIAAPDVSHQSVDRRADEDQASADLTAEVGGGIRRGDSERSLLGARRPRAGNQQDGQDEAADQAKPIGGGHN